MALKIRLARGGAKKRPFYRIVVADVRSPRDGRFIEKLGTYNPLLDDRSARVTLDVERAKHWLGQGAKPTDKVSRFLDAEGVIKREARSNPNKAVPGKKAQERLEAKRIAEEEAKAAAAAPVEEAPVEEAPAEEAPAEEGGAEEGAAEA